jgi:hypothetical protein
MMMMMMMSFLIFVLNLNGQGSGETEKLGLQSTMGYVVQALLLLIFVWVCMMYI